MNGHVERPFRAIVVGAGVTGLAMSHALQKANIDHIVLERGNEAAPASGASIAIYPHGCRILEQIGCLEAAKASTAPLDRLVNRRPDGSEIVENNFWKYVKENHGYDLLLLERREFLRILYDHLPEKSKILFGCKVKDIVETQSGVEVSLHNGRTERGDVVIGCDGVHSTVRESMWISAAPISPGLITVDEKKSLRTTWTCLIGMAEGIPALGNELSCVHNRCYSFLIGAQPNRTFFFVFFKVDKPYTRYTRPRWTDEDTEKVAASVADHPITQEVVFGELWKKRYRAQMIDIEEGVLKHWHFGRTVLVGDAAHKITPNIALGGNSGMESVTVLVNLLNRAVKAHPGRRPSKAALDVIFQEYQQRCVMRMHKIMDFSSVITRVQAWDGLWMKMVALYVLPYQRESKMSDDIGEIIKHAPKLDFVPTAHYKPRRIEWEDEKRSTGLSEEWRSQSLLKKKQILLGALVAISSLFWWIQWGSGLVLDI